MRLALDVRPLLETQLGGVGVYTKTIFESLRELLHDDLVPVVTGRSAVALDGDVAGGLVKIELPNPLLNPIIRFFGWPKLDFAAASDRYLLTNWNFLSLRRTTELTLVVHDLSFERNPRWYAPRQRLWHRLVRPRSLVRRADRIIAVSEWTKRDLVELYGVDEEKIFVVYPSADNPEVELPFPVALPEHYLLFLGAVEERKNPISLLEAFNLIAAKHPDLHLIIAGKHGFGAKKVVTAARCNKFRERIHLLGYVPLSVRRALYKKAAAFVYPSYYEGFGIPILDALRAGLPTIVGNRSSMPEVVGDSGLLVDPGDVSEMAIGLDEILSNEAFSRELSGRARERAKFFPESMLPKLRELFG
jgi:glycosyltransferase involved in cell wall biosynthesis